MYQFSLLLIRTERQSVRYAKPWAPAGGGGGKSRRSALPGKINSSLYVGPFHYFFILMRGLFTTFSLIGVGWLFLHVWTFLLLFSLCGGFFGPYGGPFWSCHPSLRKFLRAPMRQTHLSVILNKLA